MEVTKDELFKLMSVGTELAKEIQEIKKSWVPQSGDRNKENKETTKDKRPQQLAYIATQDEIFYMFENSRLENCPKGSLSSTVPS